MTGKDIKIAVFDFCDGYFKQFTIYDIFRNFGGLLAKNCNLQVNTKFFARKQMEEHRVLFYSLKDFEDLSAYDGVIIVFSSYTCVPTKKAQKMYRKIINIDIPVSLYTPSKLHREIKINDFGYFNTGRNHFHVDNNFETHNISGRYNFPTFPLKKNVEFIVNYLSKKGDGSFEKQVTDVISKGYDELLQKYKTLLKNHIDLKSKLANIVDS